MNQSTARHPISVVIPTFNRADTLPAAIESVRRQTYPQVELIVVDDGSTDSTPELVRSIPDPRLNYIRQGNQGRCAARNRGAAVATGEFVVFLDSDDEVHPNWLQTLSEFTIRPAVGTVSCGAEIIPGPGQRGKTRVRLPRNLGPIYDGQTGLFLAGSFAVRRELFVRAGGYAECLSFAENSELAMRLIPICLRGGYSVEAVFKPLLIYHDSRPRRAYEDPGGRLQAAEYILQIHGERYLTLLPAGYARHCSIGGVSATRLGRPDKARRLFWHAVRAHPLRPANWGRWLISLLPQVARHVWRPPPVPPGSKAECSGD